MTNDPDRGQPLQQTAAHLLKRAVAKNIIAWGAGIGAPALGTGLVALIATIASTVLLAGAGDWLASMFGPHPPAIATEASRPTEWLTLITQQAHRLGLPNSVVVAVIQQASDGQVYGDRWYCSNGKTTGEACHAAYPAQNAAIGPHGEAAPAQEAVHALGIGYSLMGLNGKDVPIPSGEHHSITWNLRKGVTLLAGTLGGAHYWQTAFGTFHQRFQAPPGWKSRGGYAVGIESLLGSFKTVSVNGGPAIKQDVVQGLYSSGPDLGAWALDMWSSNTGAWEDPGHVPQWVLVVGAAPTGSLWDHPWSPSTVQIIPPPPHSPDQPTRIVTRYYVGGHILAAPVQVVGRLKNGETVPFFVSTQNKAVPVWPDGTVFGARVPLSGPKALIQITATWPNPGGHNKTSETIPWPEQSSGAVSTVSHVPDTESVAQWWPDIEAASHQTGVSADWIAAEMENESGGDATAGVNGLSGAYGLMQLEPGTLDASNAQRENPQDNLLIGAELLAANYAIFHSWRLASAAYYGGAGSVEGAGVTPGMTWAQAAPHLDEPPPFPGNTLTMEQYVDNIEATAQAIAKQEGQ